MSAFARFDSSEPTAPLSPAGEFARGSEGQAVTWAQQRLTDIGVEVGTVDGSFGERTQAGLGVVGAETGGADALQAVLDAALDADATASGLWYWPLPGLPNAPVTSPFCWRNGRHHNGIDLGAGRGTAVGSTRAGTVIYAGVSSGYGNLVVVGHGVIGNLGRVHSYYAHLLRIRVSNRQSIGARHRVGDVDNTGASIGDHLHFEIRINCSGGQAFTGTPVNPCNYLARC